uniref:DEK-C domain-containing protein n=1 Tax=Cannabis sativa TaxID=3483 RepID=A0A803QUV6_CANSA
MVTDQEISQALQTLIQESSNNSGINSLNDLVQELEKKLGQDLSHKADFIRNQIHFIFRAHPTAPQQHQQPQPQHQSQSQPHPPPPQLNDRFAPHQNPNFHPTPSAFQTFSIHPQPPPVNHAVTAKDEPVSATDRPKEGFVSFIYVFIF